MVIYEEYSLNFSHNFLSKARLNTFCHRYSLNSLLRYWMIKWESQTDSPLYSIHGIFPFDPDPPLDVNYKQIVVLLLLHFNHSKEQISGNEYLVQLVIFTVPPLPQSVKKLRKGNLFSSVCLSVSSQGYLCTPSQGPGSAVQGSASQDMLKLVHYVAHFRVG